MNQPNLDQNYVISGIIGSVIFLFLFFLRWALWICILISLLTLFGLHFLLQTEQKIGNTPIDQLDQGERLAQIYENAQLNLRALQSYPSKIQDQIIAEKTEALYKTGADILKVLSAQPLLLSRSEHFLSYYLATATDILSNYQNLQESHLSSDQWKKVEESTLESLAYLSDIFSRQRDSYHQETIMELEAQSDLLEKTVKLGGGRTNHA